MAGAAAAPATFLGPLEKALFIFMVPIQPVSTRLNDEQRAKLNDLAEWLNWSESDVVRYAVLSIHEIVCQNSEAEIPVMIRMAREGRRNPVRIRKKKGTVP